MVVLARSNSNPRPTHSALLSISKSCPLCQESVANVEYSYRFSDHKEINGCTSYSITDVLCVNFWSSIDQTVPLQSKPSEAQTQFS
jgi:hypothetical protein